MNKALKELQESPEWTVKQVIETARMLYAFNPFELAAEEKSEKEWEQDRKELEKEWDLLVAKAFTFHECLCEKVAAYPWKWLKANTKLPALMSYNAAVEKITGDTNTTRARAKFVKAAAWDDVPLIFDDSAKQAWMKWMREMVKAKIPQWQDNGIPGTQIPRLRAWFKLVWPKIKTADGRTAAKERWARLGSQKH